MPSPDIATTNTLRPDTLRDDLCNFTDAVAYLLESAGMALCNKEHTPISPAALNGYMFLATHIATHMGEIVENVTCESWAAKFV